MKSVVLIVPEEHRETADAISVALGHANSEQSTYVLPLSESGALPATYWGMHAWADDTFLQTLNAAKIGALPSVDWASHGITEEQVNAAVLALHVSVRDDGQHAVHMCDTLTALTLEIAK